MIYSKPSFYAYLFNGILLFIAFLLALNNSKQTVLVLAFSIAIGIHGLMHLGLEVFYNYNPLGLGGYNPLGFNDQTHPVQSPDHDLRRSIGCCGCARGHGGDGNHTSCPYIRRGSPQDCPEYDPY
jgi:hypothetical protein